MNTKYDIGQKICFIADNALKIEEIINISICSNSVKYKTMNYECEERNAYDTPREAINSLFDYMYEIDADTDVNTHEQKTQMILE